MDRQAELRQEPTLVDHEGKDLLPLPISPAGIPDEVELLVGRHEGEAAGPLEQEALARKVVRLPAKLDEPLHHRHADPLGDREIEPGPAHADRRADGSRDER